MEAGRELDALVAEKVMSWVDCGGMYYAMNPATGWGEHFTDWHSVDGISNFDGTPYRVFKPSTDIAAAWEVAKRLDALGIYFSIDRLGHAPRFWRAETYIWDADEGGRVGDNWQDADTAPHAICLAALAAMGVQVAAGSPAGQEDR